jgi:hypothetical protein
MLWWIIVDDGETFEGNEHHWADCFFSNPSKEDIIDFCNKMGWKVEIHECVSSV